MNLLSQQNGPMPMPLLSIGTATDITNDKYTATSNHVVRIAVNGVVRQLELQN